MIRYILQRLLHLIPVLLGLTFLTFLLTYIAPSDPVEMLFSSMGIQPDSVVLERMREEMGFNKPFIVQYGDWLAGMLRGDLGQSVKYGKPVIELIYARLPNTILLALCSFSLMLLISVPLGILSALFHNRFADYIIRGVSFIGVSMPSFWLGLLLIYCFSVRTKLLPVGGTGSLVHLIMPAITLSVYLVSVYIRRVRAAVLEELSQEYVVGAAARGVSKFRIMFFHVLPNSLLTVITLLGMSLGNLLGGTIIVETIFSWNGVGKMAADSITNRDYALIQGYVIWMAFIYVGVNLFVDLSYRYLDPRIRMGEKKT